MLCYLEAYKVSSGSSKTEGDKYMLLNADDHQGLLAKMGREVATARPDITHQVTPLFSSYSLQESHACVFSACLRCWTRRSTKLENFKFIYILPKVF